MNQLKSTLLKTINFSELPTLPSHARIAIKSGLDNETSFEELTKIIKESPSLTLKVLKVANSAFYKRSGKVSTIKDAIVLLGFNTTKGLILGITLSDIFDRNKINGLNYEGFWIHSIATALACDYIGKNINVKDNRLYVAGLLHDMGKVIMASLIPEKYRRIIDKVEKGEGNFFQIEEKILGFTHVEVAEFVLQNWQFPENLTSLITSHHLARESLSDPCQMILKVSNEITHLANYKIIQGEPPVKIEKEIIEKLGLLKEEIDTVLQQINRSISPILEILKTEYKPKCYFDLLSSANNRLSELFLSLNQKNSEVEEKSRMVRAINNMIIHLISKEDIKSAFSTTINDLVLTFNLEFAGIELYLTEENSLFVFGKNPIKFEAEQFMLEKHKVKPEITSVVQLKKTEFKTDKPKIELPIKDNEDKIIGNIYIPYDSLKNTELLTAINLISIGINLFKSRFEEKIKSEKLIYLNRKLSDKIAENSILLNLYTLILDNTPFGIACIDDNMNVVSHNTALLKILKVKDLKGKKLDEIQMIRNKDILNTIRDLYVSGGEKIVYINTDETQKVFKISIHPIPENKMRLIIIKDYTDDYERERKMIQQEKLITLGQLAAGISHNLKSPLAVIKGIPELILSEIKQGTLKLIRKTNGEETDDRETVERLTLVIESIRKTLSIIDSILTYTKSEEVPFEKIDIEEIIEQSKKLLDHLIAEKGIKIYKDLRVHKLKGNRDMILQIFLNLMQNSIEVMDYGGQIKISAKKVDGWTVIYFDDEGPGVDEKDIEKIFEPFYTTSKEAEGKGLGLSITRKLVSLHGGIIRAKNLSPRGLRVEIKFPEAKDGIDV